MDGQSVCQIVPILKDEEKQAGSYGMSVISKELQQAIQKAIDLQGPSVLMQKKQLCCLLEDLVPQLARERVDFEKSYSDDLGKFLCRLYQADNQEKAKIRIEAEAYLEDMTQHWGIWGRQLILQTMGESAIKTVEVKKFSDYRSAVVKLMEKFGESMSMDIVECFVEENHLFSRFNKDDLTVIEDMYKVSVEEGLPWYY